MSRIGTKELIDEYLNTLNETRRKKCRSQVDRPELYEFEKKIGKELVDMNAEEILEMIKTFGKYKTDGTPNVYSTYKQTATILRAIFNHYIDNYQVIKNPMYDKLLRGQQAYEALTEGTEKLTFEKLQEYINVIYEDYPQGHYIPKQVEQIILLFYSGFADSKEVLSMHKDMVNFKTNIVMLPTKVIHLTDRCLYLLKYFDKIESVDASIGEYVPVSYHDSYIKFFVRANKVDSFQERSEEEVRAIIVRTMTKKLRQDHKINLNYRKIYLLGFYDNIVKKIGKEKANQLINSVRNPEETKQLLELADDYGYKYSSVTDIKSNLKQFV